MSDFRSRFTKWYCRRGYRMAYKPYSYGGSAAKLIFFCPLWVRPLVYFFFSPSVYYYEVGADYVINFEHGLKGE